MATSSLIVKFKTRWWIVTPYTKLLIFFALLTGKEPDWDKVSSFILKYGIKVYTAK